MSSEQIRQIVNAAKPLLIDRDQRLSFQQYVNEFRTIDVCVPRQSGKTTYIVEEANKVSSIVFCHKLSIAEHLSKCGVNAMTADSFLNSPIFGLKPMFNMKAHVVFVDEPKYIDADKFMEALVALHVRNFLADDFYVVKVGT